MYQSWDVVAFEQPTAAKWNILGDNDEHFHSFIGDDITETICLGQSQITSDFAPGTTAQTKITGLDTAVTIPAGGRRIKITVFSVSAAAGSGVTVVKLYNGIFGSGGTQIGQFNQSDTNGGINLISSHVPAAGARTYTATIENASANPTFSAAAVVPGYLLVEAI